MSVSTPQKKKSINNSGYVNLFHMLSTYFCLTVYNDDVDLKFGSCSDNAHAIPTFTIDEGSKIVSESSKIDPKQ